ncbi:MAG TPA: TIGR03790 family protein [Candidatus Synoicihabitans sp.]|nr:TIGR03790 family protein [Candidatus Synoicihabitans sp.]
MNGGNSWWARCVWWWSVGVAASVVAASAFAETASDAARTIVLANSAEPESVQLAQHYAQRRGIPADQVVALPMPRGEAIDWREFVQQVYNPVQDWLVANGWIDTISMNVRDVMSRRKLPISGHRIAYLVVCRGVPLKIRETPGVARDLPAGSPVQLRTHEAAVDSELALLAQSGTPIDGFVANPLFGLEQPGPAELAKVVRVARLDGPTFGAIREMIESALVGERDGLAGRAYIDLGGPHPTGDNWLRAAAQMCERLGFPTAAKSGFGVGDRADAPVLYFGWHEHRLNGPFTLPDFRFPAGAIALHIHSFSASSVRGGNGSGWVGPLVARGVAATFGNVYEPYLEYTHQPHRVLRALARGATLGEAAYASVPVLSWHPIVVGDPLYRPFAISLEQQLRSPAAFESPAAGYIAIRHANLAEAAGRTEEAREDLREIAMARPSVALALDLARRWQASSEVDRAREVVDAVALPATPVTNDWGLLAELARAQRELESLSSALRTWQHLLGSPLPRELRLRWLREARPLATEAGNDALGRQWDDELAELSRR